MTQSAPPSRVRLTFRVEDFSQPTVLAGNKDGVGMAIGPNDRSINFEQRMCEKLVPGEG